MSLQQRVQAFMDEHVYPSEKTYHDQIASGDRCHPGPDRRAP